MVKARLGERLRKGEKIFPGVQFDFLFAQIRFIAIEPDGRALRLVRLGKDSHIERLPFLDRTGRGQFFHRDVIAAADAQGNNIQR